MQEMNMIDENKLTVLDQEEEREKRKEQRKEDEDENEEISQEIEKNRQENLLKGFSQLEGACLYLRRSIISLTASADKERLLFYIDKLIDLNILSTPVEAGNIIMILRSIVQNTNVTREIRHHLIYLSDIFNDLRENIQEIIELQEPVVI